MWRSKKFIIVALLAAVVLVGSVGGVALANTESGVDSQPKAQRGAQLDRVCEIYEANTGVAIDCEALKAAFADAQSEMREAALDSYLQKLVDEDKITSDQATAYKEWQQARPDVPIRFGFQGHGKFRGMGGMPGFGGPCAP